MPGRKKSRKVGQIGKPKPKSFTRHSDEHSSVRKKSTLGNRPGSRHSAPQTSTKPNTVTVKVDPRLGSKKPIPLCLQPNPDTAPSKPRHFSPQQELDVIENDQRLSQLLERVELGEDLSDEEADYFETKMARHAQLCELLGIDSEQEDDPDFDIDVIDKQ